MLNRKKHRMKPQVELEKGRHDRAKGMQGGKRKSELKV